MQWWFDKACNILVADTSANPLSYPILEHIASSSALLHALQSISSGHRQYFDRSCFPKCLQQRSMALSQVRRELQETNASPVASFFSIMMLGMSAPWIDGSFRDTGIEHFIGARAVLDTILSKRSNWKDHAVQVIMGFYLFWDMAISLVAEPALLPRLNTPEIIDMVAEMDGYSHPIGGFPIRVFYLLARIHRYYREIMEGLARDLAFEFDMEDQLSGWQCSSENEHFELLANAFRTQGLMVLYRAKSLLVLPGFDDENLEAKISDYAHRTVVQLLQTPVTQHCFNMQAPPLTLTAAELTAEHAKERVDVVGRLRAIYSLSRVATILAAIELLEELWAMRDAGVKITYFELMEWKGWKLNLV
ncbi:fungal-specific transcription factor domain-containing protein [Thelonectria olida]|uniref:Fungal-specific transcription factor domain-containing protein n=1 Tax=Thelonectria olida TaxID=1576542 RepID=A0A9P8VS75_9HYPO|nr:fungal-specific transcription factor domain-containing protein [Thelonectria olida]